MNVAGSNYVRTSRVAFLLFCLIHCICSLDVSVLRLRKLLETYDAREAPAQRSGESTQVAINVLVTDIKLWQAKTSLEIDMEWTQEWIDPRLSAIAQDSPEEVELPLESLRKIWLPDVHLRKSRSLLTGEVSSGQQQLIITAVGLLKYRKRVRAELNCPGLLAHSRPLLCSVQFQSYSRTKNQQAIVWNPLNPVKLDPDVISSLYSVNQVETAQCSVVVGQEQLSCQKLDMTFQPKDVNFFGMEIYCVSFLLVAISWIGFWMDGSYISIRLGLGLAVVSILVVYGIGFRLVNFTIGAPGNIEVWIAFCILFVLASVIECLFVHIFLIALNKRLGLFKIAKKEISPANDQGNDFEVDEETTARLCRVIDNVCGIIFPFIFIFFNLIYWLTY